jgi:hypothetical protein
MKVGPFIRQAREMQDIATESAVDSAMSDLLSLNRTHPYVVTRVTELIRFVENGRYLEILSGKYTRRLEAP